MIAVTGEIQTRKYKDNDGNNRTAFEIVVSDVSFCGGKNTGNSGNNNANSAPAPGYSAPSPAPEPYFTEDITDEELPF